MRLNLKRLLVKVVIHGPSPEKEGLPVILRLLELQVVMLFYSLLVRGPFDV
jgi:hypothetical protein